ncbi:hypothetical protein Back11_07180 [Paenibacillus baekrokdamisoli]|uniref:Uncharacterized protein n=1 Tax=Paenibacillus baekrokdamisoli TaxID=1712516 RepID=A0A3G9J3T3_9BACL|nr:DUF3221 domain-containing protein [Paenibacillus baekrokdamisoli]MBB3067440.1 hypothetical protein [Paenibacillus baekrokdamisoli]BBH19373.1 hypothetical protein Back11_07180 [Paenibacillus baekrokdamisoli]
MFSPTASKKLISVGLLTTALTGCGSMAPINNIEPAPFVQSADTDFTNSPSAAKRFHNSFEDMQELLTSFGVKQMLSSLDESKDTVQIQIRRMKDHRTSLNESDLAKLRQAIFDKVGQPFNLNITQFEIGDNPSNIGHIQQINDNSLLIEDDTKLNGGKKDMPERMLYTIDSDTNITKEGSSDLLSIHDFKVGQHVKIWNEGFILESYPGQTSALDVIILPE